METVSGMFWLKKWQKPHHFSFCQLKCLFLLCAPVPLLPSLKVPLSRRHRDPLRNHGHESFYWEQRGPKETDMVGQTKETLTFVVLLQWWERLYSGREIWGKLRRWIKQRQIKKISVGIWQQQNRITLQTFVATLHNQVFDNNNKKNGHS